jgi:hypothetical protein
VFAHLAAELKSGAMRIPGAEEYADSRELLLSREACGPLVADYCRELELPRTATAFVARLQAWLTETARQVDVGYPANAQPVVDAHGQPWLKKLPTAEQRALHKLNTLLRTALWVWSQTGASDRALHPDGVHVWL